MIETQDEILARLIRIESKLSALMEALGFDTHGKPLTPSDERQPLSNAPRDPFAKGIYRSPESYNAKLFQRN